MQRPKLMKKMMMIMMMMKKKNKMFEENSLKKHTFQNMKKGREGEKNIGINLFFFFTVILLSLLLR